MSDHRPVPPAASLPPLPPAVRSYTKILIRERDYRNRGLQQIREYNKAYAETKEELRQVMPPNSAVEVALNHVNSGGSQPPKVYVVRQVKTVPGSVTHKRVQQFLAAGVSPATTESTSCGPGRYVAHAAQVAQDLEEKKIKALKKTEQESRKRERAEIREKKLAARNAMDQRVTQVKNLIARAEQA
jgi:hypothetical protein